VTPSTVALIVAAPGAAPVTSPAPVTVATVELLVVHEIARPFTTEPALLLTSTVAFTASPTRSVAAGSETETALTTTAGSPGVTGVELSPPPQALNNSNDNRPVPNRGYILALDRQPIRLIELASAKWIFAAGTLQLHF
jgi:hypothetical protein